MELMKIGKNTYYIPNATNIGVYKVDDNEVYLIDTGNDKEAGKKILKLLDTHGFTVKGIITTHSHADHIGGNQVIQSRTNCPVYALGIEKDFTEHPILESSFLYGGYPFQGLRNKFLLAKESQVTSITEGLPAGLSYFSLKGHSFDMIGVRTDDDVYFLGDAVFSDVTVNKYHVFFLYDVKVFLQTLEELTALEGKWCIPSHCEATQNIGGLIESNRRKVEEIAQTVYALCKTPQTFEELLAAVFDTYGLTMNSQQYVLVGSTLRSYLSYLHDDGKLTTECSNNRFYWKQA